MKKLFTVLAVLLVPLMLYTASLYDFDTGYKNGKIEQTVAAASGNRRTTFYIPDENGITIDKKVTAVKGWLQITVPTGTYDCDTGIYVLQYHVNNAWTSCGSDDTAKGTSAVATVTKTFPNLCTALNVEYDSTGFSDRYRWAVTFANDSAAWVGYYNYRVTGINKAN